NSMTALIVGVKGGHTEVVKEVLKRNPNVNMTDKDGNTALAIAAKEGHTEIVQDLLDAGTYVNIPDRKGDTALHIAIRGRSRKLAELLLRNPKDGRLLYRPNKAGETPYNIDCTHQKSILTQIFGASQQIEPLFQFSWLVVLLTLLLCGSVAIVLGFTVDPKLAIAVSLSLLALLYIFFGEETNKLEVVY
ncbi:hypothetical protein XENOCAPTIV_021014, partial [Xenoophorus captivus]